MLSYVLKRIVQLVPILFLISVVSFSIIELPPGDFADFYISSLRQSGMTILDDEARRIKEEYGFNKPLIEKYLRIRMLNRCVIEYTKFTQILKFIICH